MNAEYIAKSLEAITVTQGGETSKPLQEFADFIRQQQAEIEELKTCLIVEQEHNERMVEDRSKYEALAHTGGVEAGKELAQAEIDLLKADMRLLLKEYHQYWKEKNDSVRG